MNFKKKFGLRLKELRKSAGMTQEQLAEKLEIDTPNLSRIENGVHLPKTEKIEKIAEIFSVDVFEMFKFNHFEPRNKLIKKIEETIKNAPDKDIEFIYKIITNLSEYKK